MGGNCSLLLGEQTRGLSPTRTLPYVDSALQSYKGTKLDGSGKPTKGMKPEGANAHSTCSSMSSTLRNSFSASLTLPMSFRKLPMKSIILHLSATVTWERLHSRTRKGRKANRPEAPWEGTNPLCPVRPPQLRLSRLFGGWGLICFCL